MNRVIERTATRELRLREIYLHKIGTRSCLDNMIRLSDPNGEEDRRQERAGLQLLNEHSASIALDSTSNGIVTPENIHSLFVKGNYRVSGVYYGNTRFPGFDSYASLSFREYVSLGRPKILKVTLKTTIKSARVGND